MTQKKCFGTLFGKNSALRLGEGPTIIEGTTPLTGEALKVQSLIVSCIVFFWTMDLFGAAIRSELNFGMGLSGHLEAGSTYKTQSKLFTLSSDYVGDPHFQLLPNGPEHFLLGLALRVGSVTYKTGTIDNQAANLSLGLRIGYSHEWGKRWLVTVVPEFILYSHLTSASQSQGMIGSDRVQTANLTDYSGNGNLGLSCSGLYKIDFSGKKFQPYAGLALNYMQQNLAHKTDKVVSTSPSGGEVSSLTKSSSGPYSWDVISLQFQLVLIY